MQVGASVMSSEGEEILRIPVFEKVIPLMTHAKTEIPNTSEHFPRFFSGPRNDKNVE